VRIDQFIMSQDAIDRLADVVLLAGPDGSILDANSAALDCYGRSHTEMLTLNMRDLQSPQDRHDLGGLAREAAEHGALFEAEHLRGDGSPFRVEVWSAPVIVNGEAALLYIVRDISERKRAEQEKARVERLFRATFDHADVGIAHVGTDGTWLRVNQRVCDMLGYTADELLHLTFFDLTHPDHVDEDVDHLRMLLAGEEDTYGTEKRYICKDGSVIWASLAVAMIRDEDGAPDFFMSVITDITERKRAEEALIASESRLDAMFSHAPSGIALVDSLTGRMLETNPMSAWIAGRTIEEMCELDWMSITHPDDVQADLDNMARMNAGETNGFEMEKRFIRPDGSVVWVNMTVAPVRAAGMTHPQHVAMVEGITATKKAAQELSRQRERLARTLTSVIDIASNIVEMRDPYTAGHQRRVSELAAKVATELGMSESEVADIRVAGLLHDVGKTNVPAEILGKPGPISPVEFEILKSHSEAGYRIILSAHMEEPLAEMVLQHHERCDGSGYPRGLRCDQMLPGAKVLAVADVVEAMMSHRPYRPALGVDAALAEVEQGAGRLYDADVSRAVITLFRERGFEFS
jgi:PAS domain S-box-containing protein/putative nucleotidyltransferase with HDIG domain